MDAVYGDAKKAVKSIEVLEDQDVKRLQAVGKEIETHVKASTLSL
jgi:hypothetical protein